MRRELAVLMIGLAGTALGEEPMPQLPDFTVHGGPIPPEMAIVERPAIAATIAAPVAELLRRLPGVHVDRIGGGGVSSLYLRGADPNFTAVLLDGVKVNDPTNTRGGSFDFSTLLSTGIERIELLSGPSSALLGADALAGALNIVSRRGAGPPAVEIEGGLGDAGQRRAEIAVLGGRAPFDLALAAGYRDSGSLVPGSAARVLQGQGNVGLVLGPRTELRTILRYGDSGLAAFPEDSGGPRHAERRERERRAVDERLGTVLLAHETPAGWRYAGQLSGYGRAEAAVSPGVAPGQRDPIGIPAHQLDNELQRYGLRSHAGIPVAGAELQFGLQIEQEEGRSSGHFDFLAPLLPAPPPLAELPPALGTADFRLERITRGLFLDFDVPVFGVLLEGSLRREDPEGHDPLWLPRLRLSYPRAGAVWSLGGGLGFKLPSFFALGNPIVGNPELRPEHSEGYDAVYERRLGADAELRAALFWSRYEDAIDFEEGPPPRLVNRTAIRSHGAELGLRGPILDRLTGRLQLNYARASIEDSAERLRNRPRWTGSAGLGWDLPAHVSLHLDAGHVGRQFDSSIPTGEVRLAAHTVVEAGLRWRPREDLELGAQVGNLLDTDYEEYVGFPGPGRHARLSLQLRL